MRNLGYTKSTLTYYMRGAWRNAGLPWTEDNEAEMNAVMEEIEDFVNARIHEELNEYKAAMITAIKEALK